MGTIPPAIALVSSVFCAMYAHAALIAYEGFGYTDANGTPLTGLNGGTGFLNAYTQGDSGGATIADGLTYGSLLTSGKGAVFSGSGQTIGSSTGPQAGRTWGDVTRPIADGMYYYSLLVHTAEASRGTLLPFGNPMDVQNGFGIRIDAGGTVKTWTANAAAGWNLPLTAGVTHLVVGKLTIHAPNNPVNTIWVDPSSAGEPDVSLGSSVTAIWSYSANVRPMITGRSFSLNADLRFDELRIGTTYADVVPVPEPALQGPIAVAAAAILRRRFGVRWAVRTCVGMLAGGHE